jgi:hypothetical protein
MAGQIANFLRAFFVVLVVWLAVSGSITNAILVVGVSILFYILLEDK